MGPMVVRGTIHCVTTQADVLATTFALAGRAPLEPSLDLLQQATNWQSKAHTSYHNFA